MGCVLTYSNTNNNYYAEVINEEHIKKLSSIFDESIKTNYILNFKSNLTPDAFHFLKKFFQYFYEL